MCGSGMRSFVGCDERKTGSFKAEEKISGLVQEYKCKEFRRVTAGGKRQKSRVHPVFLRYFQAPFGAVLKYREDVIAAVLSIMWRIVERRVYPCARWYFDDQD
jgi:hypothetical protein